MTRWTVIYSDPDQDQLAQIWLDAPDRDAVPAAAHTIDTRLASDPTTYREPVHEELWALEVPPLRALFSIKEPDRLVKVVSVRPTETPPSSQSTNGPTQPKGGGG